MSKFWEWFDAQKKDLGNRKDTFTKIFEYLDTLQAPITIIETGCVRKPEEDHFMGDGRSTVLFDRYIQDRGGEVYSVDIDPKHVEIARSLVSKKTKVHCGDSVAYLKSLAKRGIGPDFVYLDSLDALERDPFLSALHCGNEFQAILPVLHKHTLVAIDDTPPMFHNDVEIPRIALFGKGVFVAEHAKMVGAELLFNVWQIGWTHMTGKADRTNDRDIEELIGRARNYVEANQTINADNCYRAVMFKTAVPKSGVDRVARGEACAFYARLAAASGAYGTATDWFREAVKADPRAVDYRLELVVKAYRPMLNWQCAEQEALRAVGLEPDNHHAWRILGDVRMSMCDVQGAIEAYDKEIEFSPGDPHAMLDRCVMALDTSDFDLVRKLAGQVLKTDRRPDGIHVLAMIANRTAEHEKAIELFQEAIDAGCNNQATAHWNKSLSLHAIGKYKEGWAEHEWRKEEVNNPAMSIGFQRFTRPLWGHEPPPAILHIHAEAGIGDNILFVRFLPEFAKRGYTVRYECHREMLDLVKRSFPYVEVVPRAPDYPGAIGIKNFDYHIPLGTMPHLLGTDLDTVPSPGRYITPDPIKAEEYRQILPKRRKIGVCWSSGIRDYGIWLKEYGKRKSMHFDTFLPIVGAINAVGATCVNLQVGPERGQADGHLLADPLPAKPSWDDTAALIENLDLVITVDTAVAHLAGALGKEVWILVQRDGASFHFMCWREGAFWNEKSPWHPTARLFRQHRFNEPHFWDEVVSDIVAELKAKAQQAA